MKKTAYYIMISLVAVSVILTSIPAMAAGKGAQKSDMSATTNPIKDIIDETASIKEMQSKPAPALSYKFDVLGNKIPTQTDNCGKVN